MCNPRLLLQYTHSDTLARCNLISSIVVSGKPSGLYRAKLPNRIGRQVFATRAVGILIHWPTPARASAELRSYKQSTAVSNSTHAICEPVRKAFRNDAKRLIRPYGVMSGQPSYTDTRMRAPTLHAPF